jgi:PAS domain S-box-containing protein
VEPAARRNPPRVEDLPRRLIAFSVASSVLAIPPEQKPAGEDPAVYQAMFDQARDGRLVLDSEMIILHANPAAVRLFGATEGALYRVPFSELLAPGVRANFLSVMQLVQSVPSRAGPLPLMGRFASGSTFPIEVEVVHGTADRYGIVVRDGRSQAKGPGSPTAKFNPGQMLIASRIQEMV